MSLDSSSVKPGELRDDEDVIASPTTPEQALSIRLLWEKTAEHIDDLIERLQIYPLADVPGAEIEMVMDWLKGMAAALWSWFIDVRLTAIDLDLIHDEGIINDLKRTFDTIMMGSSKIYDDLLRSQIVYEALEDDTSLRRLNDIANTIRLRLAIEHGAGPWQPINAFVKELEAESRSTEPDPVIDRPPPIELTQKSAEPPAEASLNLDKPLEEITKFQYKPILYETIRLLELIGLSEAGLLKGRLHTYDAENAPAYTAISWVRDPSARSVMLIEDQALYIDHELESVLQTIYNSGQPHITPLIWVDMICCNKNDSNEMNYVVLQSPRIYRQATHVYIWLGEPDLYAQLVFGRVRNPDIDFGPIPMDIFFTRPWFHQLSTLREVALARDASLNCEKLAVTWLAFERFVSRILEINSYDYKKKNELPSHVVSRVETIKRFREAGTPSNDPYLDLEQLLLRHKDCTVSEWSERIHILQVLARDVHAVYKLKLECYSGSREIQSEIWWRLQDLKKDTLVGDWTLYPGSSVTAYKQFFQHMTCKTDKRYVLDMICRPFSGDMEIARVEPSWFASDNCSWNLVGLDGDGSDPYAASGVIDKAYLNPSLETVDDLAYLSVRGFILDTISTIIEAGSESTIPTYWLRASHTAGFSKDEFWRTMIAARGFYGALLPNLFTLAIEDACYPVDHQTVLKQDQIFGNSVFSNHLEERAREVIQGRSLALTANGRIGLVPDRTEVGDRICILYGCSVPVIMSRYRRSFGKYLFSHSYVSMRERLESRYKRHLRSDSYTGVVKSSEPASLTFKDVPDSMMEEKQYIFLSREHRRSVQPRHGSGLKKDELELLSRQPLPTRLIWAVQLVERIRQEQISRRKSPHSKNEQKDNLRPKITPGARKPKAQILEQLRVLEIERPILNFVGPCYIDGMMEGDAIPWGRLCNIPDIEFQIE